jgi:hypothetical protein
VVTDAVSSACHQTALHRAALRNQIEQRLTV